MAARQLRQQQPRPEAGPGAAPAAASSAADPGRTPVATIDAGRISRQRRDVAARLRTFHRI